MPRPPSTHASGPFSDFCRPTPLSASDECRNAFSVTAHEPPVEMLRPPRLLFVFASATGDGGAHVVVQHSGYLLCSLASTIACNQLDDGCRESVGRARTTRPRLASVERTGNWQHRVFCGMSGPRIWRLSSYTFASVLFFGSPRSEGWPHHGRTFSIHLCPRVTTFH